MFENGYVKLFRKMTSWGWYQDANTKSLFIHLLLTVNIKQSSWMGVNLPKGSRATSISTLATELHSTNRKIRTAIDHLLSTGEVTRTTYSKFSVISINKWDDYQIERQTKRQANDTQTDTQATRDRQQNKKSKKVRIEEACARTVPLDADGPPQVGTDEYERWRNQ